MEQQQPLYQLMFMLYGSVTITALLACCYLLFRHTNVFAPDITSPIRLRRWTAAFFGFLGLSHIWWWLLFFSQPDSFFSYRHFICLALDITTTFPMMLGTLVVMLQDRRRPLWPIAVLVAITLIDLMFIRISDSDLPITHIVIFILSFLSWCVLMVNAIREYGRWLRDNYADLENKEVWHIVVVMAAFTLPIMAYSFYDGDIGNDIFIEVADIILILILLWRVESLQTLNVSDEEFKEPPLDKDQIHTQIEQLLQQHCVETQYYLHHDISLSKLANLIGTDSIYLSQYFTQREMTFNSYINSLRIDYFIHLYEEASANNRNVTTNQLASESGFLNYNSFCVIFKQMKGMTVSEWVFDH